MNYQHVSIWYLLNSNLIQINYRLEIYKAAVYISLIQLQVALQLHLKLFQIDFNDFFRLNFKEIITVYH